MDNVLTNRCNITQKLYINYFKEHVFKNLGKLIFICGIILIFDLLFLIYLNTKGINNIGAIVLTLFGLIMSLIMYFFMPLFMGKISFYRLKNAGEKYLINNFKFNKENFEISTEDILEIEYYKNIKKIVNYKDFSVIVMKNKKVNYIIENNKFKNGNIESLNQLIKEALL